MKIARRLEKVNESITLAIVAKAKALTRQGVDIIGFGVGEPDFDTPGEVVRAAQMALSEGVTRYTAAAGMPALRAAVARTYQERHGVPVMASQVVISVGAKHVLYNLAMALLNPGDKVLIPTPYWVSYPAQVAVAEGVPVFVETREEDHFLLTPRALEQAIEEHAPRYLILNSPSNPTGMAYDREHLTALLDVLRRYPDTGLVWDSIYERLVYDDCDLVEPTVLAPDMRDRIVVVSGFSKAYAMTGWRLGYAIAPEPVAAALAKLQSHSTSNATSFVQIGGLAALDLAPSALDAMVDAFRQRRNRMVELLRAIDGVTCSIPTGAFYALPNFSAYLGTHCGARTMETDADLAEFLLDEARVAVVPGAAFGAPGYLRLSYALGMEAIEAGMARIVEALALLER